MREWIGDPSLEEDLIWLLLDGADPESRDSFSIRQGSDWALTLRLSIDRSLTWEQPLGGVQDLPETHSHARAAYRSVEPIDELDGEVDLS